MSWECRHKSGDHCNRLDVECDPGRTGCVLHGKVYFPFKPEKNTKKMNEADAARRATNPPKENRKEGAADADSN